jgi:hypothetical protein
MNGKNCSICVYQDGLRADGTFRCCTPERQRDITVIDCEVPVKPLRELQKTAIRIGVDNFITATAHYIDDIKARSSYWRNHTKQNGY